MSLSKSLSISYSLLVDVLFLLELSSLSGGFEGVESLHLTLVLQGVLLGSVVDDFVGLYLSQLRLNLIGVDDSGEISASHHVSVEDVATLFNASSSVVSEDGVKSLEGVLGPDNESAEVTTWGK